MATKKATVSRTRNYATVVYPESAPDGWMDILTDQRVPALVSPLHDQDVNPQNDPKKPHYHVMLLFEGPKTQAQAREIFDLIGGVGTEVVQSLRGYARYLCHLDNPEKHQYDTSDVRCFCGADYPGIINLPTDRYKAVGEMMDYCLSNQIYSFARLLQYAKEYRYDWFRALCDNSTLVMREYIKSMQWTDKELERAFADNERNEKVVTADPAPACDPATGEIKEN